MEQQTKITLESKEGKIEITFNNSDVGLDQYFHAFKVMMMYKTFGADLIDDHICQMAYVINKEMDNTQGKK